MATSKLSDVKLLPTAALFAGGALVTALFSGSLAKLTARASFSEVLLVGMVVPSFTWVQLGASWFALANAARRSYWRDLGLVCLVGSAALLPATIANVVMASPPRWFSAANVLLSVAIMASLLVQLSMAKGRSLWWPASWCATITVNMLLFLWASSGWW